MNFKTLLAIVTIVFLAAGCSKTEPEYNFNPRPYETPPPRPPDPPENPAARFVVTEPYAFEPVLSYHHHNEDGFGTVDDTNGDIPMTANPYRGNMDFVFVIGTSVCKIRLPLNKQTGSLETGKYTITGNTPGAMAPISYQMPGGRYPEDISNYTFSFSMDIASVDKQQHKISGVVEMAWKMHIFDDYYASEKISSQPFVVDYNYCEVSIDGKKEVAEPLTTSPMMEQRYLGGLSGISAEYPGNKALLSNYGFFWTETLIGQYIAGKGLGKYQKDYFDIRPDSAKNLPPVGYALNEKTRIYPADLLTLNIERFNSYQFIQGSIDFKGKSISDWSDENKLRFDAQSPKYDVKIKFRYLLIAD